MAYLQNNEINTRIALKYDSFENWTTLNPILLRGEVAFATVSKETEAGFQNQPNVIIKVGDGVNHFNDLKTVSALAADVYAWAKEASKPAYDAKEINYTDDKFVSANIQDVIAEIAAELDNLTGGTAGTGSIASQIATAINGLDVAAVEAGTGEVIGKVEQVDGKVVATKKTLAKEDIPAIEMAQVTGLNEALEALQGTPDVPATSTDNSVAGAKVYADEKVEEAVESVVGTETDTAESNTIVGAKTYADEKVDEAVDSILGSASDNADSNTIAGAKVYADEKATTAYNNSVTYVTQQLVNYEQKGTAETKANEALATAKSYADGLAVNYDEAGAADLALAAAKSYADGLAVNYDEAGAATAAGDAAKTYAKEYADGLAGNYDKAGAADTALEEAKKYVADNADSKGAAAQALADAKTYAAASVTAGIEALDVTDEAVAGQFVTAVSETDGKIAVSRGPVDASHVVLNSVTFPDTYVSNAIESLSEAINDAARGHIVTLTASDSSDYAKVYTLKQGENQVGVINIPKDIVVKSGSVVDGNIVLVLNDEEETEIVIPASDLIEYVTSGSASGDMVFINVDAEHKVTATITDGTVTKAKLDAAVQTSLNLADSALQKSDFTTGATNGTIAVEGTDIAVKGLHAIAFDGNVANLTQTAETYVVFNCGSASANI